MKDKILSYLKVDDITKLTFELKRDPDVEVAPGVKAPESPSVRFNQLYELKGILGAGGFGFVLHCVCQETSR